MKCTQCQTIGEKCLKCIVEELKDDIEWIQEIADSNSYGKGGETPDHRLQKIKWICDDSLKIT